MYKIEGLDGLYFMGEGEPVEIAGLDGVYEGDAGDDPSQVLAELDKQFRTAGHETDFYADDVGIYDISGTLESCTGSVTLAKSIKHGGSLAWENIEE